MLVEDNVAFISGKKKTYFTSQFKVVQFFDNGDLLIPGNQETRRKSNNTR
jgi:hypothetical protein